MALEHVAQGQTRFFTPGVAPDPRGILLGRSCLMTFPTLEGAVSWLRLYSSEASLDELMAEPRRSPRRAPRSAAARSSCRSRRCRRTRPIARRGWRGSSAARSTPAPRSTSSSTATIARRTATTRSTSARCRRRPTSWSTATSSRRATCARATCRSRACCSGCRSASCPAASGSRPRIAPSCSSRSRTASPTASSATCGATASRRRPACSTPQLDERVRRSRRAIAATCGSARATCPSGSSQLFLGTPGHRRVPARRRERRGRGRLRASDRSRVVPVGVPGRHVPRVLARRSRRRAARARSRSATSRDLTRVDLELERPRDPRRARRRRRRVDRRRAPARGRDGPAAPRGRDADPARARRRGSSASCSRCRRCRCAAIASRSPIAASSWSARENLDVIPLGQLLCELTPGPARAARHGRRAARVARGARARARPRGRRASPCSRADGRPFQVTEGAFTTLERRSLAKIEVERATVERSRAPSSTPSAQVVNDAVGRFALWGFPDAPDRKLLPPRRQVDGMAEAHVRDVPRAVRAAARRRRRAPRRRADPARRCRALGDRARRSATVELVAVDDARTDVLSTLVVRPPAFVLERRRARARGGPPQRAVPRASARRGVVGHAIASAAASSTPRSSLVSQPLTRDRTRVMARHALLHNLFHLTRTDITVSWWTGRARFHGQTPPQRLTAWRERAPRARGDHGRRLRRAARGRPTPRRSSRRCCAARRSRSCSTPTPARRRCTGKTRCSCCAIPSSRARSRTSSCPDAGAARSGRGAGAARRGVRADARARARRGRRPRGRRVPRAPRRRCSASASSRLREPGAKSPLLSTVLAVETRRPAPARPRDACSRCPARSRTSIRASRSPPGIESRARARDAAGQRPPRADRRAAVGEAVIDALAGRLRGI